MRDDYKEEWTKLSTRALPEYTVLQSKGLPDWPLIKVRRVRRAGDNTDRIRDRARLGIPALCRFAFQEQAPGVCGSTA